MSRKFDEYLNEIESDLKDISTLCQSKIDSKNVSLKIEDSKIQSSKNEN